MKCSRQCAGIQMYGESRGAVAVKKGCCGQEHKPGRPEEENRQDLFMPEVPAGMARVE